MRRAIYPLLAVAFVATAGTARTPTVHGRSHDHAVAAKPQPRKQSKSLLDSLVMPAPANIQFVNAPYPGYESDGTITAAADTANGIVYYQGELNPFSKGHETAHILDAQALSPGDQHFFTRLFGLTGAWDQGTGYSGMKSPKEYFADWYGNSVLGHDGVHQWDDAYAPPPDPKAYRRFQQSLVRLGKRQGLQPYQR